MKDWFNDQSFLIVCTSIERPEKKNIFLYRVDPLKKIMPLKA